MPAASRAVAWTNFQVPTIDGISHLRECEGDSQLDGGATRKCLHSDRAFDGIDALRNSISTPTSTTSGSMYRHPVKASFTFSRAGDYSPLLRARAQVIGSFPVPAITRLGSPTALATFSSRSATTSGCRKARQIVDDAGGNGLIVGAGEFLQYAIFMLVSRIGEGQH